MVRWIDLLPKCVGLLVVILSLQVECGVSTTYSPESVTCFFIILLLCNRVCSPLYVYNGKLNFFSLVYKTHVQHCSICVLTIGTISQRYNIIYNIILKIVQYTVYNIHIAKTFPLVEYFCSRREGSKQKIR